MTAKLATKSATKPVAKFVMTSKSVGKAAAAAPTLEGEGQAIVNLLKQGEDMHWQVGTHYNTIVDDRLPQSKGYATAQDYFKQNFKSLAQSTLTLYGSVAKAFPENVAQQYGTTKLGHLLTYETLAHVTAKGDPGKVPVQVPQKDGSLTAQPFAACSVANLTAAIKHVQPAKPDALPAADRALVQRMQSALTAALGESNTVVLSAKMKGRRTVLALEGVPLAQTMVVLDALKAALLGQ